MDSSSVLWETWHEQLKGLLPGIHGHQKKTLALFVLGIVLAGSAVMQRVAETVGERGLSGAKMPSIERRLARFIANSRVVMPLIWKHFLEQVMTPFRGQRLYFVLDNTPFRDDLTIVYLCLLMHSRVLPVAWAVMPAKTKWDESQWQIVGRLLDQVRVYLPETHCTLIADRGLAGMPLVKLCTARGWHYTTCYGCVCRAYLSTIFSWQAGTRLEAPGLDRTLYIQKVTKQLHESGQIRCTNDSRSLDYCFRNIIMLQY